MTDGSKGRPDPRARCPCGAGPYHRCCGPLHAGERDASTAEQLMRSRYGAFALADEAYLLATWHPLTRPPTVVFEPGLRWLGLEVLGASAGGLLDTDGTVEFVARWSGGVGHETAGRAGELHERSRFVRHGRRWAYLGPDGVPT